MDLFNLLMIALGAVVFVWVIDYLRRHFRNGRRDETALFLLCLRLLVVGCVLLAVGNLFIALGRAHSYWPAMIVLPLLLGVFLERMRARIMARNK